jgi:hypothetical protein
VAGSFDEPPGLLYCLAMRTIQARAEINTGNDRNGVPGLTSLNTAVPAPACCGFD